jgi:hypothetical protein
MALLLIVLAFFGFVVLGTGGGSSGVTDLTPATTSHHSVKCSARMKTPSSAGENRRDCGGPPANP